MRGSGGLEGLGGVGPPRDLDFDILLQFAKTGWDQLECGACFACWAGVAQGGKHLAK